MALYQAFGTAEWAWKLGDNSFYWGFAVRPRSANTQVEVVRQWTTSDNDFNQVEHFDVTVSQRLAESSGTLEMAATSSSLQSGCKSREADRVA